MPKLPQSVIDRNAKAAALIQERVNADVIATLKVGAKRIAGTGKVFSNGQTGCWDGVYELADGRIMEVFLSHNWMAVGAIFANKRDHADYDYIAYHVYWESAFN